MMSYMSSHPEDHGTGPDDTHVGGPADRPSDRPSGGSDGSAGSPGSPDGGPVGGPDGGAVGGPAGGPVGDPVAWLEAAIAAVGEMDLGAFSAHDCAEFLKSVERAGRRLAAVQSAQVDTLDRDGLYAADGHWSAAVMIRHIGSLSGAEGRARLRVACALRVLPEWADAFAAGTVGVDQVRRIARVWANPRVRDLLSAAAADLLVIAQHDTYRWFDAAVTQWERQADTEGTVDADSVAEKAALRRELNGTWRLEATFRSAKGVVLDEIFKKFCDAELAADWDAARAEHGDAATWADLPRSEPQRRADALAAMFFDAAATPPGSKEARMLINLVMPYDRYCRELEELAGTPCDAELSVTERLARCGTLDGTWIDPRDAARLSIGAELRRVVIGAAGAVIEAGNSGRFFRGTARDAVMLRNPECVWAGCWTGARHCQADHIIPWSMGGPTSPTNGSPQCGRHNRLKNHHFTVWCDPDHRWHTYRPDGTEI